MIRNIFTRYFSRSSKDFKYIYKLGEGGNSETFKVKNLYNNKYYTCKQYYNSCKNKYIKKK